MAAEAGIELEDELVTDALILVEPRIAQDVRRGDDGVDAVGFRGAAEGDGFLPRPRAIVDAWKAVKMDVNQRATARGDSP